MLSLFWQSGYLRSETLKLHNSVVIIPLQSIYLNPLPLITEPICLTEKFSTNQHNTFICFANLATLLQQGLYDHQNCLLRKSGLSKAMKFNQTSHFFIFQPQTKGITFS